MISLAYTAVNIFFAVFEVFLTAPFFPRLLIIPYTISYDVFPHFGTREPITSLTLRHVFIFYNKFGSQKDGQGRRK